MLRFVVFAAASGLLIVLLSCAMQQAAANMCVPTDESIMWKHSKGSFKRQPGTKNWREYNERNEASGDFFVESLREGTAVVIHEKKRNVKVLLKEGVAGIQHSDAVNRNDGNFNQLFSGDFVKVMDCTSETAGLLETL